MKRVRVGDIITLHRRPVVVDVEQSYDEIGVRSFGKGIFHKPTVRGASLINKRIFGVAPGDLVLSNMFAWEGGIAVAGASEQGKVGSHRFLTYRPTEVEVDVRYLCYFFLSERGLPLIQQVSPGAAGRNRTLGIKAFEDLVIPLPTKEEQRRAVHGLDLIVEATERVGSRAAEQSTALEALHERLVTDSPTVVMLHEVLSLDCVIEKVEPGKQFRLAGVYGFGRGIFSRGVLHGADTSYRKLHRLQRGQVVVSRLKAFEGAIAAVPDEFDGWVVSPEFPTFSLKGDCIHPGYMEMLCEWSGLRDLLSRASKGVGERRERVGAEAFLSVSVPFPSMERQRELAAVYSKIRRIRDIQRQRQQILGSLWRSALNEAFADVG